MLEKLLFPTDSDTETVRAYLRLLGVPVTKTAVKAALGEHPDSPSLLSVSDALSGFGVENVAAKVNVEQLGQIEVPFMARMKSGDGLSLTIVKRFDGDTVIHLPPGQHRWVTSSTETFQKTIEGIVLVGEAGEGAGQRDYAAALATEKRQQTHIILGLLTLPALAAIAIVLALFQDGWAVLVASLYILLALVGSAVCVLLLWYEVDRHNPALKQVCSGKKNVDCAAILQSGASSLFGVSWSLIGFSYFTGASLALLAGGIANPQIYLPLSALSLSAIPYIIFSLYYQWRVAKQWCVLCLLVQGILVVQAMLVMADGRLFTTDIGFSTAAALTLATCFALPFLAGLLIVPAFKKAKEGENHRMGLARLKHSPQIFQALLGKQRAVTESTDGLGIRLGNPNAKHRIIKVCNPYCGPCAKAHPAIEEILCHNPNVQVQIIFTASDDVQDGKASPVKHLLAIAEKGDEQFTKQALGDWYNAPKKENGDFVSKYPMNGEIEKQGHKLTAMREWCNGMEISFTPTFFVNGYQLPDMYNLNDLKYFLRS